MRETVVISVDYESPPAHRVARNIWSALSRTALNSGLADITARWDSLQAQKEFSEPGDSPAHVFIIGQDRPEAVELITVLGRAQGPRLYGVIVATPETPSPLSGSLLYQGVGRLTAGGVRTGEVLPALIPASPKTEGEAYAAELLARMLKTREARGRR